jgi:hypothetical protein
MGWRDKYKMHPSAGVFPMMEGEELTNLVKDITEKGLKTPITVDKDGVLLDGRNRLQALERAGIELQSWQVQIYSGDDPVGYNISVNVHRRHLTKKQIADLIVAAYNAAVAKPPQDEAVFKGGVAKSIWSSKRPLPTPRNTASARARSSGH